MGFEICGISNPAKALLEAELFLSLLWLFDVIFSCWLEETVSTLTGQRGHCPFLRCFRLLSVEKGKHHLPPSLAGTEAELFLLSLGSLWRGAPSVPLELLFNVSYNHLPVQ